MNDIKFACPQCQQHIRCATAHAGRLTACPACGVTLKIPQPGLHSRELLVAGVARPAEKTQLIKAIKSPARLSAESKKKAAEVPMTTPRVEAAGSLPSGKPEGKPPSSTQPRITAACICPACRASLEIRIVSDPVSGVPSASAVVAGPDNSGNVRAGGRGRQPAGTSQSTVAGSLGKGVKSQQARPGGGMKPRMSYVLTGKPPAPKISSAGTVSSAARTERGKSGNR